MSTSLERVSAADEEVRRLEELWNAPATTQARAGRSLPSAATAYPWLWRALVAGWLGVLVAIFFAPAGNPDAVIPVWVDVALWAWWITLMASAALAVTAHRGAAIAGSALAGGIGMVLGYACKATEHHTGAWWAVEAVSFAALTALSIAALAARRRATST
jgi:hypothetical protein